MPLARLYASLLVPCAIALTAGAFVSAGEPRFFLGLGSGALATWGLALRQAFRGEPESS